MVPSEKSVVPTFSKTELVPSKMSPELRLERAGVIIRAIRGIGGEVSLSMVGLKHSGSGEPLFRQLERFYAKEAIAYLAADLLVKKLDHV